MEEEDNVNSNASGIFDGVMPQYLEDKFDTTETKQSASGFDSFLNDRFGAPTGPIRHEQTVAERFAELKKRSRYARGF